ncbi:MAG TPA: thiamine pyrophosphate-requiring protein [Alphaproteobacteria bacterium]|jgi:acetolactate synthase-1/2/3 large subunit
MTSPAQDHLAAEALLVRLRECGVEYLFANGGTDFPPIVEALARGATAGAEMPQPVTAPHETLAVGMAHGYYLVTGRPQAAIVHVNVGLGNATMPLMNAASDNVPIVMMSGRTPITESGRSGSRSSQIHWGQEMRDQTALVRETVKWDYELRYGDQAASLADRAMSVAVAAPRGPVYLSLPREPLAEVIPGALEKTGRTGPKTLVAGTRPAAEAIAAAAKLLAGARYPLIVVQRPSDLVDGFGSLVPLAERLGAAVVEFAPTRNAFPMEHPLHAGYQPDPWLADADVVLCLDTLVPWTSGRKKLKADCKVIQVAIDPLFTRTPVRDFPADMALAGDHELVAVDLLAALGQGTAEERKAVEARTAEIAGRVKKHREGMLEKARAGNAKSATTTLWVSHCLNEAIDRNAAVFTELGCNPSVMSFTKPGTLFRTPLSGGLGWGLPAALGAQLADRDRLVVACVGDGSYLFSNPAACHQLAGTMKLPVLFIVFNNGHWGAVRRATEGMYPDGAAMKANSMPVTALEPETDYAAYARASGGFGETVMTGEDVPAALKRALHAVKVEKRQALLNVRLAL